MPTPTAPADPLLPQAEDLVLTAREAAAGAYAPMLEQFPFLDEYIGGEKNQARWNFFVAVACVYIAAARLQNLELGALREAALMGKVSDRLEAWDLIHARACFENCKDFFGANFDRLAAAGHEERYLASDTLGLWIAWSLLNRAPESAEEKHFVRSIGVAVTHGFFNWWTVKPGA